MCERTNLPITPNDKLLRLVRGVGGFDLRYKTNAGSTPARFCLYSSACACPRQWRLLCWEKRMVPPTHLLTLPDQETPLSPVDWCAHMSMRRRVTSKQWKPKSGKCKSNAYCLRLTTILQRTITNKRQNVNKKHVYAYWNGAWNENDIINGSEHRPKLD